MTTLLANPELIRNVRAQLRWGRVLTAAVVCVLLSLAVGFSMAYEHRGTSQPHAWGLEFFNIVVLAQVVVLLMGGGVACLHAVQREKDTNTFDFQRITRLAPLELALGKLLGAPATSYFVVLCLMPAALVGAIVGRVQPSVVLSIYVVLVLGSICFHALALLISLLVERGAASAAVLLFLVLVGMTSTGNSPFMNLGMLSPFAAPELIEQTTVDVFFGWRVHHVFVLVVLYLAFTGWFLLAVARNIKRDPAVYELFTPMQALGFALYVNLVLVGFFRWKALAPLDDQVVMLTLNTMLFFVLGLALLRNRDRLRRLREAGGGDPGWAAATWPAPYLITGTLLVGLAVVAIHSGRDPGAQWDPGLAIFRVVLFSLWLARDVLYLQWMNLRRSRHPVVLGAVFLAVFYACAAILFAALGLFGTPKGLAFTALFVPAAALGVQPETWSAHLEFWFLGLVVQVVAAGVFVVLQRRKLAELSTRTTPDAAVV